MKIINSFKYLIILLSFSICTVQANNQIDYIDIYQFLDKSGLTKAINSFPMQMNSMGQQLSLTEKDPAEFEEFTRIMNASTNVDGMQNKMFDYVKNNISATDIKQILDWLDGDLPTKIVQAELRSTEPDFYANLMRYMANLQQNPPSPTRRLAINNFLETTQTIEQSRKILKSLVRNMFVAIQKLNPQKANNFAKEMNSIENQIASALEQEIRLTSYYIYENISDEELSLYSQFFHTQLGKKYLDITFGAMGNALKQWADSLMTNIIKEKQKQ